MLITFQIFILFMTVSHASLPGSYPCSGEAEKILKSWSSLDEWDKQLQSGLTTSFHASPTTKVGEWVMIKPISEGVVLAKADQAGRLELTLKGRGCQKETKIHPHPKPMGTFRDEHLRKFVEANGNGLIYVWSPRMPLSKKGIDDIRTAAKKLKVPVLILVEKGLTPEERNKLGALGKEVDSFELKMRQVEQHYPAVLTFKNKKIHSGVKYGHETADRYQLELAPRFQ